ncbi:MAG TPA: hypothetical protein DDW83_08685 [Peptococcaceae bacterium]|nr:hypothetical protein [Peptococcaceae bacterium]
MIDQLDAVVLAGGGGVEEGAPSKALISLNSRLMVDYVVEALRNSSVMQNIVLVGDDEELKTVYGNNSRFFYAEQGTTPLESFAAGVDALESANLWLLVCTGDIPFLTTAAVDDFISKCSEYEADFYYPIVREEAVESRFPGVKRTYASLRDGTFTGGNLLLVRREIISRCLSKAEEFVRQRKNPTALARLVGFGILWRYFLGRLHIADVEERVARMVGAKGCAVISDYPEIGVDVDKASDLEMAKRLLEG